MDWVCWVDWETEDDWSREDSDAVVDVDDTVVDDTAAVEITFRVEVEDDEGAGAPPSRSSPPGLVGGAPGVRGSGVLRSLDEPCGSWPRSPVEGPWDPDDGSGAPSRFSLLSSWLDRYCMRDRLYTWKTAICKNLLHKQSRKDWIG